MKGNRGLKGRKGRPRRKEWKARRGEDLKVRGGGGERGDETRRVNGQTQQSVYLGRALSGLLPDIQERTELSRDKSTSCELFYPPPPLPLPLQR